MPGTMLGPESTVGRKTEAVPQSHSGQVHLERGKCPSGSCEAGKDLAPWKSWEKARGAEVPAPWSRVPEAGSHGLMVDLS